MIADLIDVHRAKKHVESWSPVLSDHLIVIVSVALICLFIREYV